MSFIELKPKPSFFIKSIAEQGYKLETALADLIDNSISANASEVNIFLTEYNYSLSLFIADNGSGMTNEHLIESLRMPSQSLDDIRKPQDLGRFGLGLKTASFSQARKITVISRDPNSNHSYNGYCWDLENLETDWNLLKLNKIEIDSYIKTFLEKRENANLASDAQVSTIVIWEQLFRENNNEDLAKYLNFDVQEHISLVFHRFLDRADFKITIGNIELKGFNPFPAEMPKLQSHRFFQEDSFTVQGFTLPYFVLKSKSDIELAEWVMKGRNLSDMEGIYLYRENRLIYFGGWLKLHRRHQYLKLARLMINISNNHDQLFQINVAKSTMQIPKSFTVQFREIIQELGEQARTIYFQRQPNQKTLLDSKIKHEVLSKEINEQGVVFTINEENEIYKKLKESQESKTQQKLLDAYVQNIVKTLNKYVNIDNGNIEEMADNTGGKFTEEEIQKFRNLGISDYVLADLIN